MRNSKLFWRINESIRAPKLRVVGADGKQVGVLSLSDALAKSKKEGLDLIEIAPNANPPVAKIANFGKFRYQEEKKIKRELKKAKATELKEIRFSPFIAENDFSVRFERVKEFLKEKNKVKIVVVFKGKQMGSKPFGYEILKKILKDLGETIAVDMEPKFIGRHLIMIISPTVKVKRIEKEDAKTKN